MTLPESTRGPISMDETTRQVLRDARTLYSVTGDIKDANTLLVNRAELRAAIDAELARQPQAERLRLVEEERDALKASLHDAATSLETLSTLSGRPIYGNPPIESFMGTIVEIRAYAANRAMVARAAMKKSGT